MLFSDAGGNSPLNGSWWSDGTTALKLNSSGVVIETALC
jgi:hypothetical protein